MHIVHVYAMHGRACHAHYLDVLGRHPVGRAADGAHVVRERRLALQLVRRAKVAELHVLLVGREQQVLACRAHAVLQWLARCTGH